MQLLAKKYAVVLPFSLFERCNNACYNTIVMIDSDGSIVGRYRKSHIPDGTGYQEKFYFSPGDSGFQVFSTSVGRVGVAICWDQWFPEAARAMALMGADVMLYPTAIGSEPQDPTITSADHWQRVMQGHAAANMVPVVASNRHGTEVLLHEDGTDKQRITFYGRSFATDETGHIVAEAHSLAAATDEPIILVTEIDAAKNRATRSAWGLFRDRRPELYGVLMTKDGTSRAYGT
jgi:N-carbamoylputrescine amidase